MFYVIGGSVASASSGYFPAEISSLNEQYIPIGYNSTSLTYEPSINRFFSTDLVVFAIVLTVSFAVTLYLFFYIRKISRWKCTFMFDYIILVQTFEILC